MRKDCGAQRKVRLQKLTWSIGEHEDGAEVAAEHLRNIMEIVSQLWHIEDQRGMYKLHTKLTQVTMWARVIQFAFVVTVKLTSDEKQGMRTKHAISCKMAERVG
jgi:hypothetical protein